MSIISSYLYHVFRKTERANKDALLHLLRDEQPGRPVRLLDCGCGDGSFTAELVQTISGAIAFGIEGQANLTLQSRGKDIQVVQADLNINLPYVNDTFDIVHSNQVIEHLIQTDNFFREIWRVLKPGGRLILSTNNLAAWHNVFSLILGKQPPPAHVSGEIILGNSLDPRYRELHPHPSESHYRIFTFAALREFLNYYGFVETRFFTTGYYPLPPRLAAGFCAIDRAHGAFLIYDGIRPHSQHPDPQRGQALSITSSG